MSTELKYVYGIVHYFSRELIYRPDTWTRNNTWSIVRRDKATLVCQIWKSLNWYTCFCCFNYGIQDLSSSRLLQWFNNEFYWWCFQYLVKWFIWLIICRIHLFFGGKNCCLGISWELYSLSTLILKCKWHSKEMHISVNGCFLFEQEGSTRYSASRIGCWRGSTSRSNPIITP